MRHSFRLLSSIILGEGAWRFPLPGRHQCCNNLSKGADRAPTVTAGSPWVVLAAQPACQR